MSGVGVVVGEHPTDLGLHRLPWRKAEGRIEIALQRDVPADARGGLLQVDAPVQRDHVRPESGELFDEMGRRAREENQRGAWGGQRRQHPSQGPPGETTEALRGERAGPQGMVQKLLES